MPSWAVSSLVIDPLRSSAPDAATASETAAMVSSFGASAITTTSLLPKEKRSRLSLPPAASVIFPAAALRSLGLAIIALTASGE